MALFRRKPEDAQPADVYVGLRQQVLGLTPDQLGDEYVEAPIVALLMETGYPKAVATLVAVVDGSSSLYLSNGGGVIGAGTHPPVAGAVERWLASAREFLPQLAPIKDPALPEEGFTQFVAVTAEDLRGAQASEEALGAGRHALSPLFFGGHDVITQIRLVEGG